METTEIETERRFLLKRLPKDVRWDKRLLISQNYLTDKDVDVIERVRSTTTGGLNRKFYHTTKERLTDMSVTEIEREVEWDEYSVYLERSKRKILKERNIKKIGKLKWEIDTFNHPIKLIIAEIELPNEEYDLEIPEWLKPYILLEITGMKQFSNSNLAE